MSSPLKPLAPGRVVSLNRVGATGAAGASAMAFRDEDADWAELLKEESTAVQGDHISTADWPKTPLLVQIGYRALSVGAGLELADGVTLSDSEFEQFKKYLQTLDRKEIDSPSTAGLRTSRSCDKRAAEP